MIAEGQQYATYDDVPREKCKQMCIEDTNAECARIEYGEQELQGKCNLSTVHTDDVPGVLQVSSGVHSYDRVTTKWRGQWSEPSINGVKGRI